jgi:hypothetical protein
MSSEPGKDGAGGGRNFHSEPDAKSVWEVIDEAMKSVPEEDLRSFPVDGAEQHDHYLYGCPRRARRES